jgi:hypothetical protein
MRTVSTMANGIAHISFPGGGVFLPARSPYDRQLLAEHIGERVQAKGQVQVLMREQCWIVRRKLGAQAACCNRCGMTAVPACYSRGCEEICYCVACAVGEDGDPEPLPRGTERRVG